MGNRTGTVKKTVYYLLMLITGGQIVFGIMWICGNIGVMQMFAESVELIEISTTQVLDEYVGILYPLLIACARGLEKFIKISWFSLIYILQLTVGFLTGCRFLFDLFTKEDTTAAHRKIKAPAWINRHTVWGSLYLMTMPMCLQIYMAILPQSLAHSFLLLLLILCKKWIDFENVKEIKLYIKMIIVLAGTGLMMPDYVWLAAIMVIGAAAIHLYQWYKNRKVVESNKKPYAKQVLFFSIAVIMAMVLCDLLNGALQTEGSRGRIQKTLGAAMLSRVVWPYFDIDYYFWPEEVKEIMDDETAKVISCNPEQVIYKAGPLFEEALGREDADKVYWQLAAKCGSIRTKEILGEIARDFAAYLCPPISLQYHLSGAGIGFSGWNYGRMKMQMPFLTKVYVRYALNGFNICIFILLLVKILQFAFGKHLHVKRQINGIGVIYGLTALVQVIFYTMSASGMMDYKNVLLAMTGWGILIYAGIEKKIFFT